MGDHLGWENMKAEKGMEKEAPHGMAEEGPLWENS